MPHESAITFRDNNYLTISGAIFTALNRRLVLFGRVGIAQFPANQMPHSITIRGKPSRIISKPTRREYRQFGKHGQENKLLLPLPRSPMNLLFHIYDITPLVSIDPNPMVSNVRP